MRYLQVWVDRFHYIEEKGSLTWGKPKDRSNHLLWQDRNPACAIGKTSLIGRIS
jgi:hypothetical protein